MGKGPAIYIHGDIMTPLEIDCTFRVLTDYLSAVDTAITRIDIKINGIQYCAGFRSNLPGQYDLVVPKTDAFSVQTSKSELISALKELISDLEKDNETQA